MKRRILSALLGLLGVTAAYLSRHGAGATPEDAPADGGIVDTLRQHGAI